MTLVRRALAAALLIAAFLGLSGPALAADPPSVNTGAVFTIAPTVAQLAGSLNPRGSQTTYTYEYGPSLSFGQISAVQSAGAGSGFVAATGTLSGLQPATTYYYRLVATNAAGTQFGEVAALRTTAGTPVLGAPTSPTQTNGAVNAIVRAGDRTYLGGSFTRVGVPVGYGASLAPGSGTPDYAVAKPNGLVKAVVSDGAGGWFIGGAFTAVGDVPRSRLAHLLADGSVDPAFDPHMGSNLSGPSNSDVRALALAGTTLYAGGDFTRVGSGDDTVVRNFLAAIDVTTGRPTSFDAALERNDQSQYVTALAVSGSKLWIGGTLYANPTYQNLLAVDRTSGALNPISEDVKVGPNYPVVLAAHGGKLYVGGNITAVGGVVRNYLAAIDESNGRLDAAFDPDPNSAVTGIAFAGDKLYAGGNFTVVNHATVARSGLAAFSLADGAADPAWNPVARRGPLDPAQPIVSGVALAGSTLYVSGSFDQLNDGAARNNLAAVDLATGTVTAFDPNVDRPALAIASGGGRVYAGGSFSFAGAGTIARGVAVLRPDGTLDPSFDAAIASRPDVRALALTGGKLVVGSELPLVLGGVNRGYLAAFDAATAARAASFDPNVTGPVDALAASSDTVYAGGAFGIVNTSTVRTRLAAFDASTGVARAFDPNASNRVNALVLSGGRLYAGGTFTFVNGSTPRTGLAALDATTGVADPAFAPSASDVRALALADDGTLYLGGAFTSVAGMPRNRLAAVDALTGAPTGFDPNVTGTIASLAVSGARVYAGGEFSAVGGVARSRLAALNSVTGTADPAVVGRFDGAVGALFVSGTEIYAGGSFAAFDGRMQMNLARFSRPGLPAAVTGAASAVTSTTVVIAGELDPLGSRTDYAFEYGPSLSFGRVSATATRDVGGGSQPVSTALSGLLPGTTYYYRLVATNSTGTTRGTVASFTTAGAVLAPLASTAAASGVTASGALLSGTVDARGSATAFTFEYGPTNAFGSISAVDSAGSASGVQSVSLPVSGLAPATEYRFRIVATNANGTSIGTVGSFTTSGGT